ncbi:winged helix-turn-helix domain-containing protein [Sulfurimonas sp.]
MFEKLKNTLRTVDMLYVIEEKWDDDYHLMPFRLICDHISLSDLEKAWEMYLLSKPSIVLIHAMIDNSVATEFIKKIRYVNSKCTIIVLTSNKLKEKFSADLNGDIQKLIVHPIGFENLIISLESSIDYDNLYYYINDTLLFEPNSSSLVLEDKRISLTKKETQLLMILLQNRHRIVSYVEIENYVWQNESMSRNTLTSIVRNIRKKSQLKDLIKNFSGQGYQINLQ